MNATPTDPALCPTRPSAPFSPRHYPKGRHFQGIPSVVATRQGRLFACWYSGGVHEGPENYVALATSADGGLSWADPAQVVDPPHPNVRAFDPNLWLAPDGALWLFWTQGYSQRDGNTGDGRLGVWTARCANPETASPVWEEPVRIANGAMMNKPLVLSNGEWVFPTALWNDLVEHGALPVRPELRHQKLSGVTVSDDQGKSFAWRGGADVPDRCYDEHQIVELKDGRLWMLVRANYGIGQSFSSDSGRTWTPGEPSSLKGPNSRFFIRRLRSGLLLLVNNIDDSGLDTALHKWRRRHRLTAFLSDDDGKTWPHSLLLDPGEYTYPDGWEDEAGNLWVICDHERHKGGFIHLSRLREEDVMAGRLVTPEAFLNRKVSEYPYEPAK